MNNTTNSDIISVFNTTSNLSVKDNTTDYDVEGIDDIYADLVLNLTSNSNIFLYYYLHLNNNSSSVNFTTLFEEKNFTTATAKIDNITSSISSNITTYSNDNFPNITFSITAINSSLIIHNNYSFTVLNTTNSNLLSNISALNQTIEYIENSTTNTMTKNENTDNYTLYNAVENATFIFTNFSVLEKNETIMNLNSTKAISIQNNIFMTTNSINENYQKLNQSDINSSSQVLLSNTEIKNVNESLNTTLINEYNQSSNFVNTTQFYNLNYTTKPSSFFSIISTYNQTINNLTSIITTLNLTTPKVTTRKSATPKPNPKPTTKKQIKSFKPASTIKQMITNKTTSSVKPNNKNSNTTTKKVIVIQNKHTKKAKVTETRLNKPRSNRYIRRKLLEVNEIYNEDTNLTNFTNINQERFFNLTNFNNNFETNFTNTSLKIESEPEISNLTETHMNQTELEKEESNETDFRSIETTQINKTPIDKNLNLSENYLKNDADISIYDDEQNKVIFDIRFDMTFNISFGKNKNYSVKKINDYSFKLNPNQTHINLFDNIKENEKYITIDNQEKSTTTETTKKVAYFEWITGPFSQVILFEHQHIYLINNIH